MKKKKIQIIDNQWFGFSFSAREGNTIIADTCSMRKFISLIINYYLASTFNIYNDLSCMTGKRREKREIFNVIFVC
jgi:hypothetical protein